MDSLLAKLEYEAFRGGIKPRSKESVQWFMQKAQGLGDVNRRKLMKDDLLTQTRSRVPIMGSLCMYFYDPKHRKTLPYYDTFPLVFMVDKAPNGFYGLNMHYLPPKLRAVLFDNLLELASNKRYDDSTRLRMSYALLKGTAKMKHFAPCFKHYLTNHVESKVVRVEPPEWEVALFLPTEQFNKANKRTVWAESRKIIKGK